MSYGKQPPNWRKTRKSKHTLHTGSKGGKYYWHTVQKGKNKGKPSCNPKGKNPSDIWEIISQEWEDGMWENIPNVKQNHCEKTKHPCQFPVELVERCVLALTNEDDWVLDPYSGVGSTIVAAINNNRKGAGSEMNQAYFDIAEKRIADYYAGTLKTRNIGTKIYTPKGKVSEIPQEWKEEHGSSQNS